MGHFRKVIFNLFSEGQSDTQILVTLKFTYGLYLAPARLQNYRQLFERLDAKGREDFIEGKLNLMGKK